MERPPERDGSLVSGSRKGRIVGRQGTVSPGESLKLGPNDFTFVFR